MTRTGADDLPIARSRFTPPVRVVTAVTVALATALGAWIFYNTNVLNHYETADDREALQADYEKRYKAVPDVADARSGGDST